MAYAYANDMLLEINIDYLYIKGVRYPLIYSHALNWIDILAIISSESIGTRVVYCQ